MSQPGQASPLLHRVARSRPLIRFQALLTSAETKHLSSLVPFTVTL